MHCLLNSLQFTEHSNFCEFEYYIPFSCFFSHNSARRKKLQFNFHKNVAKNVVYVKGKRLIKTF